MLICSALVLCGVGWRSALLSPPAWWIASAATFTIVPALAGKVNGGDQGVLTVLVSDTAVSEYLLYVGLLTLGLSIGWRLSMDRDGRIGGGGIYAAAVPLSLPWLMVLAALGVVLNILSGILSGIDPRSFFLTINEAGTAFYEGGSFRFSVLRSAGLPILMYVPSLVIYTALGAKSSRITALAVSVFGCSFALFVLSGVRLHLVLFMATSALAFVVHPRAEEASSGARIRWASLAGCMMVLVVPIAMWMQERRSLAGRVNEFVLRPDDLWASLDLVTPSAALIDWVRAWGFRPGVSLIDALQQAPPSFLAPQTDRAEFLTIVDSQNLSGSGAAVSTAGEMFVNFGWIGGILVAILIGSALGTLQRRLEGTASGFGLVLLLALGPTFAQIFTRGYLWQSLYLVLVAISVALMVNWLAGDGAPALGRASRQRPRRGTGRLFLDYDRQVHLRPGPVGSTTRGERRHW